MNKMTYNTTARVGATSPFGHYLRVTQASARVVALLLFLVFACTGAWAQDYTDRYQDSLPIFHYTYDENNGNRVKVSDSTIYNTPEISIAHHPAMWYWFRDKLTDAQKTLDTFDDASNGWMTTMDGKTQIQAAHASVDTLYVHKGDTIHLVIPYTQYLDESDHFMNIMNYYRWYDYKSDGLFDCNLSKDSQTVYDLLTPTVDTSGKFINGGVGYRFKNGYVSGSLNRYPTNNNNIQGNFQRIDERFKFMTFYYPTDEEFKSISKSSTFNGGTNDYYVVACDISSYMDFAPLSIDYDRSEKRVYPFATDESTTEYNEPTLSARAIFYIMGVDDVDTKSEDLPENLQHYLLLKNEEYQGGTNYGTEKYLEEYEMTYPSRRLSNYTNELIAVSKPPHGYAIPGATGDKTSDKVPLVATIADNDNSAGLALVPIGPGKVPAGSTGTEGEPATSTKQDLTGYNRSISFCKYGTKPIRAKIPSYTNGTDTLTWPTWVVEDGSTATILVTKTVNETTYNIARYKITFKEEYTPLTQTQVAGLSSLTDEDKKKYWWGDLEHRTPEYMEEHYELLTSITFDYDTDITAEEMFGKTDDTTAKRSNTYPFPLDWESASYSFIGGLDRFEQFCYTDSYRISPGEYSISNNYYYDGQTKYIPEDQGKNTSTGFWMNVDATEAPARLATLEFGENLCPDSKLYVTAWIKSLNPSAKISSSVLLSIAGVYEDGTEVLITQHASGQIQNTYAMPKEKDNEGDEIDGSISGVGYQTNCWMQIYFSFINQANAGFDHYALRIDNRGEGSSGADYVFDEVKVYVLRPNVDMTQMEPLCTANGDEMSSLRMDLDYEVMMSRLGYDPDDYTGKGLSSGIASVDFVIINKAKYYNALATYDEPTQDQKEEAFKAALVTFWGANEDDEGHIFPTLDFYLDYSANKKYDDDNPGGNIVTFGDDTDEDEAYFYYRMNGDIVELSMDCYTNMMAYTEYVILLEPHTNAEKTDADRLEEFIALRIQLASANLRTKF